MYSKLFSFFFLSRSVVYFSWDLSDHFPLNQKGEVNISGYVTAPSYWALCKMFAAFERRTLYLYPQSCKTVQEKQPKHKAEVRGFDAIWFAFSVIIHVLLTFLFIPSASTLTRTQPVMSPKCNPEFGPKLNYWIRKLFCWQFYPYCLFNCLLKRWRTAICPCKLWSFIAFLRTNSCRIRMKLRPFAGVPAAGFQFCPCQVSGTTYGMSYPHCSYMKNIFGH